MRYIFALLIIAISTYIGAILAQKEKQRIKEIKAFLDAFRYIKMQILLFSTPIKNIFLHCDFPDIDYFFKDLNSYGTAFTNRWEIATENAKSISALSKKELSIIKAFGKSIGKVQKDALIKEFDLNIAELEGLYKAALDKSSEKIKAIYALGFAIGAMIALLLI